MADDGRIIILVDTDTKGYDRAFAEMQATAKSSASKVDSTLSNTAKSLSSFGATATKAVTLPIIGAATACAAAAVKIDTSLTNVKKTVNGTEQQYQKLKDAAVEFSRTNAVTASQILDIQSLGAQLGFAIEELDEFSRVASGLSIATDMGAETASTEMAQFANITRMAHADISNYASAIVNLGNNLATTESKISSMAQRVAAAGTQTKMTQAQILGWSAAMSSLGIEAEAGGTAFSLTISTIDAAVAKGGKDLDAFAKVAGMSSKEFSESWKNSATETMIALLSSASGAENLTIALEDMGITGIRQSDVFKRLAGNTDLVTKAIKLSNDGWRENTALQNEVDNRNASMAAQLQMLQNRATECAEKFGKPLVGALISVVEASEPLIKDISKAAEMFSKMDVESQRNILKLIALAAAIGPVASGAGKLIEVYDSLKKVQTKITDAFAEASAGATNLKTSQLAVNGAMAAGKVAATALSTAMKTIAPIAVISVLLGVIGDISMKMEEAKQKAEEYKQATDGLKSSMEAFNRVDMSGAAQQASAAAKSFSELVEAQASFAETSTTTWGEINGQNAALSAFVSTIGQLTDREQLNEQEQARLSAAVAGYNELTGESVQITDLQTGKLNVSTASLKANAEAWKLNAQAQALQKELVELYTSLTEKEEAYAVAQANTANAYRIRDEALRNGITDLTAYDMQIEEYEKKEAEAKGLIDSTNQAIDARAQKLGDIALAQQGTTSAISDFISKNKEFQDNLNGVDVAQFSSALSQLGFDTSTLAAVGAENFTKLSEGFNGNINDLIAKADEAGIQIPGKLSDGLYKGSGGVYVAAGSVAADVIKGLTGVDYTETGGFVAKGVADGIEKQTWEAELRGKGLGDDVIKALNESLGIASPSKRAAEAGGYTAQGLAQGMAGNSAPQNTAQIMGANVISSLLAALVPAGQVGAETGGGYASGIGSQDGKAKTEGQGVADSAKAGLEKNRGKENTWGRDLVSNFAQGIRGAVDLVSGAVNSIADVVKRILGHSVAKEGPLHEGGKGEALWGRHLVENFAGGIKDASPAALKATESLAASLSSTMSNIEAPLLSVGVKTDPGQLDKILNKTSVTGLLSGSLSLDAFGKRLQGIESRMGSIDASLKSLERGVSTLNATLKEPVEIDYNKREFGRMVRGAL